MTPKGQVVEVCCLRPHDTIVVSILFSIFPILPQHSPNITPMGIVYYLRSNYVDGPLSCCHTTNWQSLLGA